MASVINDPNGRRRIMFMGLDGRRKAIYLGKIDRKSADGISRHIEALLSAKIAGQGLPRDTAAWLESIGAELRNKLAKVELVTPLEHLTVADFLDQWLIGKREMNHKPTSLRVWGQTVRELAELFGKKQVKAVTQKDAESYRSAMIVRKLKPTTIHKRLGHARQIFEDAIRHRHIEHNPWKFVKHRTGDPSLNRVYIPVENINKVIDVCPTIHWKLLVAMGRFAGLRVPSEAFELTWGNINWEKERINVPSPKTENQGKSHRVIPIFPLLKPILEEAYQQAPEGTVYVFPEEWRRLAKGSDGWGGANMRTQLTRYVLAAGLEPWPRIWHNLRASCESDLAEQFPLAVVTKWLGNTPSVALRHYVDPTDGAFEQAKSFVPKAHSQGQNGGAKSGAHGAQNRAQQAAASNGTESHDPSNHSENLDDLPLDAKQFNEFDKNSREGMGIEPTGSFVQTPRWF